MSEIYVRMDWMGVESVPAPGLYYAFRIVLPPIHCGLSLGLYLQFNFCCCAKHSDGAVYGARPNILTALYIVLTRWLPKHTSITNGLPGTNFVFILSISYKWWTLTATSITNGVAQFPRTIAYSK